MKGWSTFIAVLLLEKNGILMANFNLAENAQSVMIRLTAKSGGEHAVITRINDKYPNGITTEEKWLHNHTVLKIKPGEVIFIEIY